MDKILSIVATKTKSITQLIKDLCDKLGLNLKGKTVLTEAANSVYAATACIPAYAGAQVYAYAIDNEYSSKKEKIAAVKKLAEELEVINKIKFIENIDEYIKKADFVTNSYSLRPLNKEKLSKLKPGAKILLMYEEWEKREEDIEYEYCKNNNIQVISTDESRKDFNIFQYVGWIAIKVLLENNINIVRNKIAVIGRDKFSQETLKILRRNKAEVVELKDNINYENLAEADTIIFCDYENKININWNRLDTMIDENINIIQLVGMKNTPADLRNIKLIPDRKVTYKSMGYTFEYLGPQPVVEIIAASYREAI